MDEDEAEEEKVPTEPHTILGDLSTATAMVAEEIFAHSPPRADTAAGSGYGVSGRKTTIRSRTLSAGQSRLWT
ncbi:hypothetical protein T03_6361 [Trichinella britovi]|uniref:Uncharacterized protein n=1 Tax=Trichinella britovi TaxID=45882 RepID=A0A0V1CPY8_TRIBR|nr:hypothetical protein T03_6361 [Trichinella britovi]